MTLADRIREVLRAASGPMTSREVREALDDDSVTAANVASPLFAMCGSGEVMREAPTESGSGTYLIDPTYVPKRAPKEDPVTENLRAVAADVTKAAKSAVAKRQSKAASLKKRGRAPSTTKTAAKPRRKSAPPKAAAPPRKSTSPLVIVEERRAGRQLTAAINGTVPVGRGSLRTMALALMHLHPDPMPDGLKSAVLNAIEATL